MNLKTSLLTLALAASSLLAFNAGAHGDKAPTTPPQAHDMSKMQGHDMKGHSAASMELHKIMMSGTKGPMKMTGDVDKDFASMMTMHHQQAIKMADVLIKSGRSPQLKAMARKMKAAQSTEIKQLAPYTK